jgi:gamma-glutamyltranspeptidase/glutathione hydrolase
MWRQSGRGTLFALLLLLTACGGKGPEQGDIGFVDGFFGGLIADEPRTALVGREVLSAGGTAADAAIAAYFTMAVTLPGSASLGGGGVCLLHDAVQVKTEVISFLPKATMNGSGTFAVPANIRGMFLLHARYGQLSWSNLLEPAEGFARNGHTVSRAFVRDYQASRAVLEKDPEAREIFKPDVIAEGKLLRQLELAALLANLRTRGPGEFYDGSIGKLFADAVTSAGGQMTITDLREYRPEILEPLRFPLGNNVVVFPPTDSGLIAARIWESAREDDLYEDEDPAGRYHVILEAAARAYQAAAQRNGSTPMPPASTLMADFAVGTHTPVTPSVTIAEDTGHDGASIVAVDNQGRTVACSFTMNGPFGSGVVAPGTGVILANPPAAPRAALPSMAMMVNEKIGLTFFAAAGSGPVAETVSRIALDTVQDESGDVISAIVAPRAHTTGNPDVVVVESDMSVTDQDGLRALGHDLRTSPAIGRINGFYCPRGLPRVQTCQFVKDPRSFGLAVSADE